MLKDYINKKSVLMLKYFLLFDNVVEIMRSTTFIKSTKIKHNEVVIPSFLTYLHKHLII